MQTCANRLPKTCGRQFPRARLVTFFSNRLGFGCRKQMLMTKMSSDERVGRVVDRAGAPTSGDHTMNPFRKFHPDLQACELEDRLLPVIANLSVIVLTTGGYTL